MCKPFYLWTVVIFSHYLTAECGHIRVARQDETDANPEVAVETLNLVGTIFEGVGNLPLFKTNPTTTTEPTSPPPPPPPAQITQNVQVLPDGTVVKVVSIPLQQNTQQVAAVAPTPKPEVVDNGDDDDDELGRKSAQIKLH